MLDVCLLSIWLIAVGSSALASNSGKVVVRENVSATQRQELIASLKSITGWSSLRFDQQGVLQVGREPVANGSATARSLLGRAVDGDKVIVLEDASSRLDVAFCRVVEARWLTNTGTRLPAFVVLIDFADFHEIIGDKEARAAFNVGWGVLHELDHVVSDSTDADEQGLLGECETHINAMRREIGLPGLLANLQTLHVRLPDRDDRDGDRRTDAQRDDRLCCVIHEHEPAPPRSLRVTIRVRERQGNALR